MINKIWNARKPSTVDKYCQALRKFFEYCSAKKINLVLPLDSLLIADYITEKVEYSNAKGTATNALTSLRWLYSFLPGINSNNNPLNDDFLSRITQSVNRNRCQAKTRKKPFSKEIIAKFVNKIDNKSSTIYDIRNSLIPALAFSLLLRHDEVSHINCSHITELEKGLKFSIPSSKTDTYREGKYVFLTKENKSIYNLFFCYLNRAGLALGQNHFLFCPISISSGKINLKNEKLTYGTYRDIIRQSVSEIGLDPMVYGTHSCRSGGASALAPFVSQYDLMLSCRWADPRSIGSYVETPQERRFEISQFLNIDND